MGHDFEQESSEARIARLEACVRERDATIQERDAALKELKALNATLREQVSQLTLQVATLTELAERNSRNSNLPPSSDGPGSKNRLPKKKKSKSGRTRGGQQGHKGAYRKLVSPELVDTFVDLYPEVCLGCAKELPQEADPNALRYQVWDLIEHKLQVTEYRRHKVRCSVCGRQTLAAYERSKIPQSSFGATLTGVVGLLTGTYHLSRRQAQSLLQSLFNVEISLGAISNMEARLCEAFSPAYEEAVREVDEAEVKHTDATSWVRSGVIQSLWTLASSGATVYQIFKNGCRETILPFFGSFSGILVRDRAPVLDFWDKTKQQICWAHLVRKFISFSERDGPAGTIGRTLCDLSRLVFEYWHGYKIGLLTREDLPALFHAVRRALHETLKWGVAANIKRLSGSCADLLYREDALFTFVTHEGVEPTNNHAEREVRPFVLWRKRCSGSQSERGDRFAALCMTVVRTLRKQKKKTLDFIVKCVATHFDGTTPPRLIEQAA